MAKKSSARSKRVFYGFELDVDVDLTPQQKKQLQKIFKEAAKKIMTITLQYEGSGQPVKMKWE